MDIKEVEKVLNELDDYIQGKAVDSDTLYKVRNYVNKLKELLEIDNNVKKDEIVFKYEDDNAKCEIIKIGVDGNYYFTMYEKSDNYYCNSIEDGIEFSNDGVYTKFERCFEELKETYESSFGEEMKY